MEYKSTELPYASSNYTGACPIYALSHPSPRNLGAAFGGWWGSLSQASVPTARAASPNIPAWMSYRVVYVTLRDGSSEQQTVLNLARSL